MGRKNTIERIPQHSRRASEQRRWRAGEVPVPLAMGFRRELHPQSAVRIMTGLRQLQLLGELPDELDFRLRPYVDLVSLGEIGRQTRKGIAAQYDLRKIGRRVLRTCPSAKQTTMECDIKNISMKTGGDLRLTLESTDLQAERVAASKAFEDQGFKGLLKECAKRPLHLTLATCRRDSLAYDDRQELTRTVIESIEAVHEWQEPLVLGALTPYPHHERIAT